MADQRSDSDEKRPSRRVADVLRSRIEAGDQGYRVGDPLAPYRQLADEFGVAVNTAMAAVVLLRDSGWVTGKPNGRSFVRDSTASRLDPAEVLSAVRAELDDLREQVHQVGANLSAVEDRLAETVSRLAALEG